MCVTYPWKLGPVLELVKAVIHWIIHSEQITQDYEHMMQKAHLMTSVDDQQPLTPLLLRRWLSSIKLLHTWRYLFSHDTLSRSTYK